MAQQHNQERLAMQIEQAVFADAAQSPDNTYCGRMLQSCRLVVHSSTCKDNPRCQHCSRLKVLIQHYKDVRCGQAGITDRRNCAVCSFMNEIFVFHARNCASGLDCRWGPALRCPEFKLLLVRSELQNG